MGKRDMIFLMLLLLTLAPLTAAYDFCEEITPRGELEIKEITYQKQADDEVWTWEPVENLNIEVSVENKNFTERDFTVELFLINENSDIEEFASDIENTTKTISLDKDQTKTLDFSLQLKEGLSGTYSLHAKLTDTNNESICTTLEAASVGDEATIEIKPEEKIIIVRKIDGPTSAETGSSLTYTVEVINLGNTVEERVMVVMYNSNFGVRQEREIISLGVEESKSITFSLAVPEDAAAQEETILFHTEYDYQNETGFYYQSSNKDKIFLLQIEGLTNQTENLTETNQTTIETNQPTIETNQTMTETNQSITETTQSQVSTTEETTEDESEIPYFWTIVTIIFFAIIITIIFLFLKYKGTPKIETITEEKPTTAASDYVKNIQKKSAPVAKPVRPVQPARTVQPLKSVQSSRPVRAARPVRPLSPVKSTRPIRPTRPTSPTDPNKPF